MSPYPAQSGPVRIVTLVVAVAVIAGIVYFGLRYFTQWHAQEIETAVREEQVKFAKERVALEKKAQALSEDVARLEPVPVPEERIDEVFGAETPGEPDCDVLEERIRAFFEYLDGKADDDAADSHAAFVGILGELSRNPPVVIGETRDMFTLMRNQAHFFRILDPARLELVTGILAGEKDVLEHTIDLFYSYYVRGECCKAEGECLSLATVYDYASFFLNTLSGQSYMMRRESTLRGLTRYYSVRVLDQANDQGLNRYGMDIRPHIASAMDDIRNLENLLLKERYLAELEQLTEKYPTPPPRMVQQAETPVPAIPLEPPGTP